MTDSIKRRADLANEAMQDQFDSIVHADVVEWPRLSQAVRLEREAATHSCHVYDVAGHERGIFYSEEAALRFLVKHGFHSYERKNILREMP